MKKQNVIIVGIVAFILAVAVGYAIFSETITISGTAGASGDFNVEFTSVGEPTCKGFSGECTAEGVANIEDGNNKLTVTINKLDYPGAYVEIPVTITNKGSIPARLKQINQSTEPGELTGLKVTYSGVAASELPINQNQTQEMTIRVEWDQEVNSPTASATFTIDMQYEQITATTSGN